MIHRILFPVCIFLCIIGQSHLYSQESSQDFQPPKDIEFRSDNITSEGTRISAEIFSPKESDAKKLPTILMSHGWGGTANNLRPDAIEFARAGFLVVTIDYRGWGKSDGRLIPTGKTLETKDGKSVPELRELREVVDPIDQTTDILNALNWIQAEELCDKERIGIWGSSFSGGHVVYVAARDPRVKAFVSQVGSMDQRWTLNSADMKKLTFSTGTGRTRGTVQYPEPGVKFGSLHGFPILEKLMRYAPIEDVHRIDHVAKLYIIAENEELFDNKDHGILAYEKSKGVKKLVELKGIKHYGVYYEKRKEAQQAAIDWYNEHLKK